MPQTTEELNRSMGVGVTPLEKEAARLSYRQATPATLDAPPERLELLDRAERVGDKILALAAYHEAVDRSLGLADQYRQRHPDAAKKWQRYVSARTQRESVGGMLSRALQGMPPGQERF